MRFRRINKSTAGKLCKLTRSLPWRRKSESSGRYTGHAYAQRRLARVFIGALVLMVFFLENGSFFARLGLWLIMGVMVTSVPLAAVGFLLHCAAFYKDAKPRAHTTFRNKMLFGRTYYPGEIDDEISAGIRFAIIIGYVEAGVLVFELL